MRYPSLFATTGALIILPNICPVAPKPSRGSSQRQGGRDGRTYVHRSATDEFKLRYLAVGRVLLRGKLDNLVVCEQQGEVRLQKRWSFCTIKLTNSGSLEPEPIGLQTPPRSLSDDGLAEFPNVVKTLESAWMFPVPHRFTGATSRAIMDATWLPFCRRYYVAVFVRATDLDQIICRQIRNRVAAKSYPVPVGDAVRFDKVTVQEAAKSNQDSRAECPSSWEPDTALRLQVQDIQEIASQVLNLVCQPEVTKSFCFLFTRSFGKHQALSFIGSVFDEGLDKGCSATDDPELREQLVLDCQTIMRPQDIREGSRVVFTCNADSPPLCSIVGSINDQDPLEFWGGLRGPAMSILLHKIFLRDPYSDKEARSGRVAARLLAHMFAHIQKRVAIIASQMEQNDKGG